METSNLLQDILVADNTVRQRAETELNNQRQSNPAALMQLFTANLKSDKIEVAQVSCVLFKKYFLDNSEGVSSTDFDQMLQVVMDSLDFKTQPLLLLKRKGDIISKIFALQNKNEDLLKLLVGWAQSDDAVSKQFAMYVFEILSECHLTPQQLKAYNTSFFTIFEKSLQDSDMKVRVATLKATTAFIYGIDEQDQATLNTFKALMQPILNTMVDALKTDETQGKMALESMVDLTKSHPQCWKDTTPQLVKIVSDIVKMKDFEEGTRSQAAEVVLTLAQQVPATLRKVVEVKTEFFPALISMLTECDDEIDTWAEAVEGEDGIGNDAHSAAVSAINRLALDMKEKFTLEACGPLIEQCIANADWKTRQAGFMTFGLIAEACKQHMKSNMDLAMQTACKGIQDEHPRVRYAGLSCLALVLTELSPQAQTKYHQELVPNLLSIMKDEKLVKVQTHAVSCMINFTNGLIQEDENEIEETTKSGEILTNYADQLFEILTINLKKGIQEKYEPLQEEVMNLLNVSASLIEEKFSKYFTTFLPLMVEILDNVESKTVAQMNLRARTIESIGFMISAVSNDTQFVDTVKQVTEKLFVLLDQKFADEDPQEIAVKEAITKIAFYLKEDFHAVAPKFLNVLVADANLTVDIKHESAELPATQAPSQKSFEFKLKGMENKTRVSVNTSNLGNKVAAFQHLLKISEAMDTAFEPYVQLVFPVVKAHITHFSRAIRKAALKTFQHLLIAMGDPANLTLFKEVYGLFGLYILKANKEENVKELKLLFKELFHCMEVVSQNSNPHFFESVDQMNSFGQLMKACLQTVAVNKEHHLATIEEKHRNVQIDEEDIAEIQTELDKITGAALYISECSDIIMKTYKADAFNMIDSSVKFYFAQVLQQFKTVSQRELQDATYFFMQFVDNCANNDKMMVYELCSQFVEITLWSKPDMTDVRQNTVYGIGVMAKHLSQDAFKSLLPNSMKAVEYVLSDPEASSSEHICVTENAYCTLSKLAFLHTNDSAHVEKFLAALPLTGDEEAQEAHQFLFEQVLQNNALLMGTCKGNMQAAVLRIQEAHAKNDGILTEEGVELMNKVLKL